jgi:hypothetical protein
LKPQLHVEALIFCLAWAALAVAGAFLLSWQAGMALSVGLFLIIMPASALVLSKTSNFALERGVRWGILALAALVLLSFLDVA